jgi:hypothetical protein
MQPDCTSRASAPRRLLATLAVVACVVAAQGAASLHALGHALERLWASPAAFAAADGAAAARGDCDRGGRGEGSACPLHALFAELGAAAIGSPTSLPATSDPRLAAPLHPAPFLATPRVVFRSRAPPALPA